jgi:hypothetical protein
LKLLLPPWGGIKEGHAGAPPAPGRVRFGRRGRPRAQGSASFPQMDIDARTRTRATGFHSSTNRRSSTWNCLGRDALTKRRRCHARSRVRAWPRAGGITGEFSWGSLAVRCNAGKVGSSPWRRLRWRASCSVDSTPFPVATSTWVFWLTLALGVVVAMRIERSPQHGTL